MTKKIIVVTGLPGSGKSEVSREIRKNRIPTFLSGNVIKEEVTRQGLDLTLESEEYVARELRRQYGPDAPIKLLEHKISDSNASLLCVDGPRNVKEVELLKTLGEVYLIIVESTKRLRYQRLRRRGGPRDPEGWKHFMWRDRKELERGMKSLIKTRKFRKYIIKNTGTLSKLKSQVSRILKDVKSQKPGKTQN